MTRPTPFHGLNLDSVNRSWRRFYPERYWISPELLGEQTVKHPLFDWGCSLAQLEDGEVTAFVTVKKSPSPHLYPGTDPDQAHITALAFDDPTQMVDLLAGVKSSLRQRGIYNLNFGADHGHFFPGAPEDCGLLRNFLEIEGFELENQWHSDVERDLSDYEPPAWVMPALESVEIRRATGSDLVPIEQFLREAFPGRWKYDVLRRAVTQKRPEDIAVMVVDGSIEGFAFIQDSSGPLPIGGGVWQESLGENWGALGPIGISEKVRGRKLGHAMLAGGLMELKKAGVKRCAIDWTTLTDFYGAHGFEVSRRYQYARLALK